MQMQEENAKIVKRIEDRFFRVGKHQIEFNNMIEEEREARTMENAARNTEN